MAALFGRISRLSFLSAIQGGTICQSRRLTIYETKLRDMFDTTHLPFLNKFVYPNQEGRVAYTYMSVKEFLEIHFQLTTKERDNFYDFMRFRNLRVSREFVSSPVLGIPIVRVGWLRPPLNFAKFNSDASFVKVDGKVVTCSGGVAFRDSFGNLMGFFCTKFKNLNAPLEAELEAFSFGLFLSLRLGIPKLVAESDCLELVKSFGSSGIKLEHFDQFLKLPFEMLEDYHISHVLKEGNFPAHILASAYDLANVGKEIDGGFNLVYDKEIDVNKTRDLMRRAFGRAYEALLKDYNRQVFYRLRRKDRRDAPLIGPDTVSTMADHVDSPLEFDGGNSDSLLYSLQEKAKSLKLVSLFVANIDSQVTETLLEEFFSSIGPIEGCKLVRKEKSCYGFIHYLDRRSAASAMSSLNGKQLLGLAIKVSWAKPSGQREDTSTHYKIFVGDLSPVVTDDMLFECFFVYPSCSGARVMWDQKTGRSRGFGFVSFRNQQEAQSAINDLSGKSLGGRQIRCNWGGKGTGANDDKQSSDAKAQEDKDVSGKA